MTDFNPQEALEAWRRVAKFVAPFAALAPVLEGMVSMDQTILEKQARIKDLTAAEEEAARKASDAQARADKLARDIADREKAIAAAIKAEKIAKDNVAQAQQAGADEWRRADEWQAKGNRLADEVAELEAHVTALRADADHWETRLRTAQENHTAFIRSIGG